MFFFYAMHLKCLQFIDTVYKAIKPINTHIDSNEDFKQFHNHTPYFK